MKGEDKMYAGTGITYDDGSTTCNGEQTPLQTVTGKANSIECRNADVLSMIREVYGKITGDECDIQLKCDDSRSGLVPTLARMEMQQDVLIRIISELNNGL